jgi:hypothetical protein
MGTRSTTRIYEDGQLLLVLYKQYDGYPDGWGQELKHFLHSGTFVNGFQRNDNIVQFNGVGDFVLQMVKVFKEETGGLYDTTGDNRQEYNYVLGFNHSEGGYGKMTYTLCCLEDEGYLEEGLIDVKS